MERPAQRIRADDPQEPQHKQDHNDCLYHLILLMFMLMLMLNHAIHISAEQNLMTVVPLLLYSIFNYGNATQSRGGSADPFRDPCT